MQSGSQPNSSSSQPPGENPTWTTFLGSAIALITLTLPFVTIAQTPLPPPSVAPPPPLQKLAPPPGHPTVPTGSDRPSP